MEAREAGWKKEKRVGGAIGDGKKGQQEGPKFGWKKEARRETLRGKRIQAEIVEFKQTLKSCVRNTRMAEKNSHVSLAQFSSGPLALLLFCNRHRNVVPPLATDFQLGTL
jgi:hypothetical protein